MVENTNAKEPVRCPWCEGEMYPQWAQDIETDGLYRAWYVCPVDECGCSAKSPMCAGYGSKELALEAAYAAAMRRAEPNIEIERLTVQLAEYQRVARQYREDAERYRAMMIPVDRVLARAEPPNRVLTLEELQELPEIVWRELRDGDVEPKIPYSITNNMYCIGTAITYTDDTYDTFQNYQKTWRPWLRKPTAEERAAVPWKEAATP